MLRVRHTSGRVTEHQIVVLGFALSMFGGICLRHADVWREYREAGCR
jgi:hypothetical protein